MHDRHPLPAADPRLSVAPGTPPLTAAAAHDLTASRDDLAEARRRDLLSAINSVVRIAGLPADLVLLTPKALRETLLQRSATACGISAGTKANVESLLRGVLTYAGVIDAEVVPVAGSWSNALGQLHRTARHGLTRLARFCSGRQIAPADVTEDTFTVFRQHVQDRTLVGNPDRLLKTARRAWNRACSSGAGWPGRPLARRVRRHDYVLPPSAFPVGFQADLAALGERLAATALDDPFAPRSDQDAQTPLAPARALKPATVALRQDHCRWAASAVAASGVPIAEITSLVTLVTPLHRARDALRFLHNRAGHKPSAAGMHVAEALAMIARHVAHLPAADIKQLQVWSKTVRLTYRGMTETNTRLMREALDPERDEALLALPDALLAAAYKLLPSRPQLAASLAMRALGVGLLSRAPLRLKNIYMLRLDRHLHRPDPARARVAAAGFEPAAFRL